MMLNLISTRLPISPLVMVVVISLVSQSVANSESDNSSGNMIYSGESNFTDSILNQSDSELCKTLYLLNIVPFPDPSIASESWDGGFEVIPAGHVAARHINNRSDILNGYELELIDVDSDACGINPSTKGVVNFYKELVKFYPNTSCIVGIVGLYCSSVTQGIAPIASHPKIDYVTLAASTSADHRNVTEYPQLFHSIASFAVVEETVVAMMRAFKWSKIGLVNDNTGVFFYSTANAFAKKIESEPELELVTHTPLSENVSETLDNLIRAQARISFWSVSAEQAAQVMCEAYHRKLLWEGYVYIFHGHSLSEILAANSKCSRKEIVSATYGIFLLNYHLADMNKTLDSDISYEQYYQEYVEELRRLADTTGTNISVTDWANSLYDQVWAFALALNSTIDFLNGTITSDDLFLGNKSTIFSDKIINELEKISFEGASGHIQFGKDHEVQTSINIIQVRNGSEVVVGIFNSYTKNITFSKHVDAPKDTFHTEYKLIPKYVGGIVYVIQFILLVLITFNLILFLMWRKQPLIKATSPPLSILMFVGCYLLCLAPIAPTVNITYHLENETVFVTFCHLEHWLLFNGINLIFATLFLRLLRIYHIFKVFRKTGKYWSDSFLFLYIVLICSIQVVILVIWTGVNPLHRNDTDRREYVASAHPPYYRVTEICVSKNLGLWIAISYIYSGLIFVIVMFLAVQTRHIKRAVFKDTKKVNVFVFSVVVIIVVATTLQYLFASIGIPILEYLFKWFVCLSVPCLCQLILFLPKTFPLFLQLECINCKFTSKSYQIRTQVNV